MNTNVAIQNSGVLAWTGINAAALSPAIDIRQHIQFAFTFKVLVDIAVAAVFEFQAAPPSSGDPCVPGAFVAVPEVPICSDPAVPDAFSRVTIPVGTKAGAMCTVALPCRPNAFVKVISVSGDTSAVQAVMTLSGPR
jgi:hypothetical protein